MLTRDPAHASYRHFRDKVVPAMAARFLDEFPRAPLARRVAVRGGREGLGRVLIDVKRKLEQGFGH